MSDQNERHHQNAERGHAGARHGGGFSSHHGSRNGHAGKPADKRGGYAGRSVGKPSNDRDGRSGKPGDKRGGYASRFDRAGAGERSDRSNRAGGERRFDHSDRAGREGYSGRKGSSGKPRSERSFDRGSNRGFDKNRVHDGVRKGAPRGDLRKDGHDDAPAEKRSEVREGSRGGFRGDDRKGSPRDFRKNEGSERPNREDGSFARDAGRAGGSARGERKPAGANKRSADRKRFDASPARRAALQVGRMLRERDAFAQDLISKYIDTSRMSREDRAFATRLVLGVVSAAGTLDEIIDRSMNSPDDVKDDVRDALRIGVYELYFLDKRPHAAVDQCVELVRTFEPRACGFANAVLRKALAMKEEFPFGNPRTDIDAFARQYAFPTWLAKRLVADMGYDAARDFMEESNEPAPLFVAVNAALASDEEVRAELEAAHGDPEPVQLGERVVAGCYRISSGRVLQDGRIRRMINQGKLFVSDAASQEVAHLVLPEALPDSLLEIGAGRATKTLLLQGGALRAFGTQIPHYTTVDNHEFKTKLLLERTESMGIQVEQALTADAKDLSETLSDRLFEVVFIDAPCSGLGTLRRHPEIRWRLKAEKIDELAEDGLALLKSAAAHVKVGGTLAFATCTVTHAENNAVVMRFLESPEGASFALAPINGKGCFATRLQSGSSDAHFLVKMLRVK